MDVNAKHVVHVLNHLIQTCLDGSEGFKFAAERVKDGDLKRRFGEYALERAKFRGDLEQSVQQLGEEPEDSGSAAAYAHRAWIALRTAVTEDDDPAVLDECIRGESEAVDNYEEALKELLPEELKGTLKAQHGRIQAILSELEGLKSQRSAQSGS